MAKSITLAGGSKAKLDGSGGRKKSFLAIRVDGLKELEEALAELSPKVMQEVEKTTLREIAKPVLADVKSNAPKGATLRLSESFKIRAMRRKKGRVGVQIITSKGWFQGETFYAAFQEFGWRVGKRKTVHRREAKETFDKRRQIPGKHFVEKAYDAARPNYVARFREKLPLVIERVTKRLARKAIRKAGK